MGNVEKEIIRGENLTVYTAHGEIAREDVKNAISDFYTYGPVTKNVMWDLTHAQLGDISSEDVKQIATVPRQSLEPRTEGKTAIVAPDDLAFGLSRMYQNASMTEALPFQIKIFREYEEARQWLTEDSPIEEKD